MLMNKVETLMVTSPANRVFQRCVEAPMLRRLGGRTPGARALEIGCGSGYGTKLIIDQFGAATVDAVDLDPAMVTRARRLLRRYHDQVRIVQGSADDLQAAIGADDATYDAVFDFGIIHHITNWRDAVAEVARVLRPGGTFYYLEVTAAAFGLTELFARMDTPERRPVHRRPVPRRAHQPGTRLRQPVAHLRRQRLPRVASPGRHKPAAGGHCRSVDRTPTNGHPRETRQPYVGR